FEFAQAGTQRELECARPLFAGESIPFIESEGGAESARTQLLRENEAESVDAIERRSVAESDPRGAIEAEPFRRFRSPLRFERGIERFERLLAGTVESLDRLVPVGEAIELRGLCGGRENEPEQRRHDERDARPTHRWFRRSGSCFERSR